MSSPVNYSCVRGTSTCKITTLFSIILCPVYSEKDCYGNIIYSLLEEQAKQMLFCKHWIRSLPTISLSSCCFALWQGWETFIPPEVAELQLLAVPASMANDEGCWRLTSNTIWRTTGFASLSHEFICFQRDVPKEVKPLVGDFTSSLHLRKWKSLCQTS